MGNLTSYNTREEVGNTLSSKQLKSFLSFWWTLHQIKANSPQVSGVFKWTFLVLKTTSSDKLWVSYCRTFLTCQRSLTWVLTTLFQVFDHPCLPGCLLGGLRGALYIIIYILLSYIIYYLIISLTWVLTTLFQVFDHSCQPSAWLPAWWSSRSICHV